MRARLLRRTPVLALALLAAGCTTALVGGGAAVVLGTAAVLAHQCYDHVYVDVSGPSGRICNAKLVASRGDDRLELTSCYYAALTEGTWTLHATAPGLRDASTTVIVDTSDQCNGRVQTIELTMPSLYQPPAPPPTIAAPPPPPPPPVATATPDAGAAPPQDAGTDAVPTGVLPDPSTSPATP